jgi:hypothetical protein
MTAKLISPEPVEAESYSVSTFRLRRRTPGSFVLVPFPKGGRSIRCQGQLEAAAAVILANCPLVTAIHEQPLQIWYAWRETESGLEIQLLDQQNAVRPSAPWQCTYIVPDFLVRMTADVTRLIEVKPFDKVPKPDVQRKLSVARCFAEQNGWSFHVLTERELRRGPLLGNLRLLSRYRRLVLATDGGLFDAILSVVAQRPTSLGDLCEHFASADRLHEVRAAVLHLVVTGRLDIDPRYEPISDSILLHAGGSILWEPFDSVWEPSGSRTVEPFASSANSAPINSPSSTSSSTSNKHCRSPKSWPDSTPAHCDSQIRQAGPRMEHSK